MSSQVGHKMKDKHVAKWSRLLGPQLLPGEEVLAMMKCNNLRPATNGIVVTSYRLGGVSDSGGWSVVFPYDVPFTMTLDAKKETAAVRVVDPASVPGNDKLRRDEMLFKMVQSEDHPLLESVTSGEGRVRSGSVSGHNLDTDREGRRHGDKGHGSRPG